GRQSGRCTPAAATSIRTSPAFGLGTAPSVSVRTPGGPGSRATTWRLRLGSDICTSLSLDGLHCIGRTVGATLRPPRGCCPPTGNVAALLARAGHNWPRSLALALGARTVSDY